MGLCVKPLCCTVALLLLLGSQPSSCDLAGTIGAINSNTASTVNAINSNTANTVGAVNSNSANTAANVASAANNNAANTVSAINNNTANTVAAVDGTSANNAGAVAGASNNNAANTVAAVNSNTANTVGAVNNATANNVAAINSASANNAANTVSAVNNNTANTVAAVNGASTNNANNIVGAINNSTASTVGAVNNASANNAANTVGAINNSTANTAGAVDGASTSNANNVVGAINNSTASTVAAVNNATASNTANAVSAINNSTANTVGAVNGASTSNANSIVGAINNSTANTVSAVNSASTNNVASIVGAINSNTAATVGAVNDATAASTGSIVAAITASTGSTVSAVNSAAAANAASVVGAINNSTGNAVAAVNNASAVAAARNIPVVALASATGTAADQAAVNLQSSLYNAANSSISAVFQQGSGSVTNLTFAAQNTVARAGVALANGQQAVINVTQVASVVGANVTGAIEATARNGTRHPVVFWPAFGTSLLDVTVANNSAANCPRNGSFTVAYGQGQMLNGFAESCIYSLLALQHSRGLDFRNQVGVNTSVRDFGNVACAPTPYAPLYSVFQGVGYQPGRDFFVACYDWRTSPNVDVGTDGIHLQRAQSLVEQAYNNTNGTRVYLHAHSNGAIYALSLLSNTSVAWRQKYIAGFIPIAGNWIGQGLTYSYMLSGQSLLTGAPYPGSARAFASWPSTYLSASFPSQYNQSEYIIVNQGTGNYTPAQTTGFYTDANIPYASDLAPLFQGNITPSNTSPGTHFYGFYGTGLPTLTGQTYTNLTSGNNLILNTPNITLNGDGRQEALGNFAALAFNRTLSPCYHFELLEVVGIPHLLLPMNPNVLQIVTSILFRDPPAVGCTLAPSSAPTTSITPSRP